MECCICSLLTNAIIAFVVVFSVLYLYCKLTIGVCRGNACLVGKTAIVTGGNAGIGYETVLGLAARGARVIIADVADSEKARQSVIQETGNNEILSMHLDLSDNNSIREFSREFKKIPNCRLDILGNNAGIAKSDGRKNKAGIDLCIQINYLGHFLITHCLADVLKKTENSRIVFTSSGLSYFQNLTVANMEAPNEHWNYGKSKLCQIIASNYFSEKLKSFNVTSNSVHPGLVKTGIHTLKNEYSWQKIIHLGLLNLLGRTSYDGGQTVLDAALNSKWNNVTDKFFCECKPKFKPYKFYNEEFRADIISKTKRLVDLQPSEEL